MVGGNNQDKLYKYTLLGITVVLLGAALLLGIDSFVKTMLGAVIGFLIGKEMQD